jgi:tetratricopeptide (TPR) repeat protein
MSTAGTGPVQLSPTPTRGARRRRLLVLLLVLAGGVGGLAWYVWRQRETVDPPTVDPAGAEPEVLAAIEAAREEVRQAPRSAEAWGQLGNVLMAHEFRSQAHICFTRAEELEPGEGSWPYLNGMTLVSRNPEGGIACWRRAVQLRGDEPILRLQLADALLWQQHFEEAENHYCRLLEIDPGHAGGRLGMGRLAYQRGDLRTSRKYLAQAAASPHTQKAALTLLAEVEQRANKATAAARASYRAAELPDDEPWPDPFLTGSNLLKTGKRARLKTALQLFKHRRPGESLAQFRDLTRDYPTWERAWLEYAKIRFSTGNRPGGEEALRRAIQLAPDYVEAHYFLGISLFQRGEYAEAGVRFRTVTRLNPADARAHYQLGKCLRRQGERKGALDAFRKAIRCRLNYAPAHTALAELLAQDGDKPQALHHLRLALELNPDDKAAKKLREKLRQDR